jgi:hypothetical protein
MSFINESHIRIMEFIMIPVAEIRKFQGKKRTPLRSIRKYCLWCCGGDRKAVAECLDIECVFKPYRLGKIPEGANRNLLKVINAKCRQCVCGELKNIRECSAFRDYQFTELCAIWPYRLGKNPYFSRETREKRRCRAKAQQLGKKSG